MTQYPKVAMTLMVRDEVDIIAANIEHHLAQGLSPILVTDNGSVDGTREILVKYSDAGLIHLWDDPRHAKQQSEVVTAMARSACTDFGADWVCNVDADEFWFASGQATIVEALALVPESIESFAVRVRNLMGPPVESGSVLRTHEWRDERSREELLAVGLHAHPTDDRVHRARADVEVVQGNHDTNLPTAEPDDVPEEARLEVLHVPYRTWKQYRRRVETTAAAYADSGKTPSPRHHGIRDAHWNDIGELEAFFVARHPAVGDTDEPTGFVRDTRLSTSMAEIETDPRMSDAFATSISEPVRMPNEAALRAQFDKRGPLLAELAETQALLKYREQDFYATLAAKEELEASTTELQATCVRLEGELEVTRHDLQNLTHFVGNLMKNPAVRGLSAAHAALRRFRRR